jgi:hypothetical protein
MDQWPWAMGARLIQEIFQFFIHGLSAIFSMKILPLLYG